LSNTVSDGAARRTMCICQRPYISRITEIDGGCLGCLENQYPSPDGSQCMPCPLHTKGPANSVGIHQCGADPGYFASYTKRVRLEITLPEDEYDPLTFESYIRAAAGGGREIQVTVVGEPVFQEEL